MVAKPILNHYTGIFVKLKLLWLPILGSTTNTSALASEIIREAIYFAGDSLKSSILGLNASPMQAMVGLFENRY